MKFIDTQHNLLLSMAHFFRAVFTLQILKRIFSVVNPEVKTIVFSQPSFMNEIFVTDLCSENQFFDLIPSLSSNISHLLASQFIITK